ncbi:DUF2786 domain-containing protein [Isorropodon fossajaponicum symbiont]|uniref:DUF2786 domain-containing protein n=1 Tax=Isorropodon fossajaponicum symbiont TaxID=883811 RepID=UPI00191641F5|nr:DUF2786 domain-containing protein [Isorropodon fossajaponicum symbiont]
MNIDDLNNKLANTLVALKRKSEQTTNENEKEVAIRFLNSQLKKHGLDMSIFDDMLLEKKQRYELKHYGMFGIKLKIQILWFLGYKTIGTFPCCLCPIRTF